jgi:hypothetical protein
MRKPIQSGRQSVSSALNEIEEDRAAEQRRIEQDAINAREEYQRALDEDDRMESYNTSSILDDEDFDYDYDYGLYARRAPMGYNNPCREWHAGVLVDAPLAICGGEPDNRGGGVLFWAYSIDEANRAFDAYRAYGYNNVTITKGD